MFNEVCEINKKFQEENFEWRKVYEKSTKIQQIPEIVKNKRKRGKMKLEALNGMVRSEAMAKAAASQEQQHHQQQQQQQKVESSAALNSDGGGGEDDAMDEGVSEEKQSKEQSQEEEHEDIEVAAATANTIGGADKEGKKKGARKKRSLNWEDSERGLLLEVVKPKVDYVENKLVDAKSIKAKRLAWLQITKQFNAMNFRHRSLEQIQVQWRSMKNSAKQKHPKPVHLEGMDMIEFMEEIQNDHPVSVRSLTRGGAKKEQLEMDDDDRPLAALPTSTNNSEDTLPTSTLALPSPPPSAESQNDTQQATPTRTKKKPGPKPQATLAGATNGKTKRQRSQHSTPSDSNAATAAAAASVAVVDAQPSQLSAASFSTPPCTPPSTGVTATSAAAGMAGVPAGVVVASSCEDKYKKQLFELMKRARLAEMDYARREHEQKLRFDQMEQELKLSFYRQLEELKVQQLREEHAVSMSHKLAEHEARLRAYNGTAKAINNRAKTEENDVGNAVN